MDAKNNYESLPHNLDYFARLKLIGYKCQTEETKKKLSTITLLGDICIHNIRNQYSYS